MIREMNEFPYFLNCFLGQYANFKLKRSISIDNGAFQLHGGTLFVFIAFCFREIICDLAREVFLGHLV